MKIWFPGPSFPSDLAQSGSCFTVTRSLGRLHYDVTIRPDTRTSDPATLRSSASLLVWMWNIYIEFSSVGMHAK